MIKKRAERAVFALVLGSLAGCSLVIDVPAVVDNRAGGGGSDPSGGTSGEGKGGSKPTKTSGGGASDGGSTGKGGAGGTGPGGSAGASSPGGSGGTSENVGGSSTGGTSAQGGATSSGGAGGSNTSGGTPMSGGATAKGGTTAVGGTTSKGGTTATGGTTNAGGSTSKGGTTATGGTTSTATTKAKCVINSISYDANTVNENNKCTSCQPAQDPSLWSPLPNGTPCATNSFCDNVTCKLGCWIGSAYFASGAPNPGNPCQSCQPGTSTATWSNVETSKCVKSISVGSAATCAVVGGAVKCWGDNTEGVLGVDPATLSKSDTPVQVQGLTSGAT